MTTWKKVGKKASQQGTVITYESSECPEFRIESRKRQIPHANGIGTWDHTDYFLVRKDGSEEKFDLLCRAKKAAEEEHWKNWRFPVEDEDQPYLHCGECEENYYVHDGHCKVAEKYQRLPRNKYRGALGLCKKIGDPGC